MSTDESRPVGGALGTATAAIVALAMLLPLAGVGPAVASDGSGAVPSPEGVAGFVPQGWIRAAEVLGRPSQGISILENAGQIADPGIHYYVPGDGLAVGFRESSVDFVLRAPEPAPEGTRTRRAGPATAALVRLEFDGARRIAPFGGERLDHPTHFLLGGDPADWRTSVRSYREVWYRGLYEGIDLVYRADSSVKYEFLVGPGGDPGQIRMRYRGADVLRVVGGDLVLTAGAASLRDTRPVAYQGREEVPCHFRLSGTVASFRCDWDPGRALRIDPIVYATYLGGGGGGWSGSGSNIAIDAQGNAFVAGTTSAPVFPTTPGAFDPVHSGNLDAYVVKLNPNGTAALFSTFLGGAGYDRAYALAVDASGAVYVTGSTDSADFPTTPGALNETNVGRTDAFVAKLSPDGDALLYSTFLGGRDSDLGMDIAVDEAGAIYVGGQTSSGDFPVTPGAFDSGFYYNEAFVSKINATGEGLVFSTFLGGDLGEEAAGIAIDASHTVYVTGSTSSSDFPTTPGAFQTAGGGSGDAFVLRLDERGQSLLYGTLLGGEGWDLGYSIAVGGDGSAYVTGKTESPGFPVTPGAADTSLANSAYGGDAFVARLDPSGSSLVYGTFLGGESGEDGYAIAVDADGWAYVVGSTDSWDFPVTPGALDLTTGSGAFLVRLNETGALAYATLLGGDNFTDGFGLAIDGERNAYLTGRTSANDFPITPNAYNGTAWDGDGYVAKILVNRPPVADAGPDVSVRAGQPVGLDGSNSSDPEGDALTATWLQFGGPAVLLNESDSWDLVLVPTVAGDYGLELTVTDSHGGLARDTVVVHVDPIPPPPEPPPGPDRGLPLQLAALIVVAVGGAVTVILVVFLLRRSSRPRGPPGGVGPDVPPPGSER